MKAVLFDLDGTLLDIDLSRFLSDYFRLLAPAIAQVTSLESVAVVDAVQMATKTMCSSHGMPTNETAFNARFEEITGVDLSDQSVNAAITAFYDGPYTTLASDYVQREHALTAVTAARDAGYLVAIATNPIFPRTAIEHRIRWAGFDPHGFDLVTSYEWSCAAKPFAPYYLQIATALDIAPNDCLMVGDDPVLDMAAADVGMRTFYVGSGSRPVCDWAGTLADVADLLPRLR